MLAAPKHACASKAAKPRRRTHSCAYVELRRMKSHCLSRVQTVTNRVVWRERPTLPLADKPGRSRISRCTISSRMTGWATCVWPTVDRHHERVSDCKQLNWCTTTHDDMIKGHAELVQWVYLYWIITSHLFPENVKKEPSIAQLAKENQGGARDPSLNIGTHLHPLESKSV